MDLPDLKKLKGIIALCRKTGVKTIKIDNIELTLSEEAPMSQYKASKASKNDVQGRVDTDGPTNEELLFWSTGTLSMPSSTEENAS